METTDFPGARTDKTLPAKTGVYAHDEHLIDEINHLFEAGNRRAGIEHDPGLLVELFNLLNGAVQMRAGFLMDQDDIRAGADEIGQIALRLNNHQVDIERQAGALAGGLDHQRTNGDIGHKTAIHHINVDTVRAGLLDLGNLLAEAPKVGRENRGENLDHDGL